MQAMQKKVPAHMEGHARNCYEIVLNDSHFVQAIVCGFVRAGTAGSIVFVSTPESTNNGKQNYMRNLLGITITDPSWMYLSVWWYPGMVPNNFAGIVDSRFQMQELGIARTFFEAECRSRGMVNWEEQFSRVSHGHHRDPFRRLLVAIGIEVWVEYTFGYSYHAYCGLDAYQRIFSAQTPPSEYEAHFLLNTEKPVSERQHTCPENWWMYQFWQSYGQHSTVDEWVVSVDTRGSQDQSMADICRMPSNISVSSLLADENLVWAVYRSLTSQTDRMRLGQLMTQCNPGYFRRMLMDTTIPPSKL